MNTNKRVNLTQTAYQINKKNYINLSNLCQNVTQKGGGVKDRDSEKIIITNIYQLTLGSLGDHQDIKLPEPEVITKIGKFYIDSKPVIGDIDYSEIDLASGTYDAYQIDDNIMIINTESGIVPDKSIKNWTWVYSGQGVGVDSGCFGFYDKSVIEKINKLTTNQKIKQRSVSNNLPTVMLDYSKEKYIIVDGSKIDVDKKSVTKDKLKILENLKPFGVMGTTTTGDGGFECYVIGTTRAILLGGLTSDKLFEQDE